MLVAPVETIDEGIARANASEYGLTAGFYGDADETERFFATIEAGVAYANRPQGATTGAWPGHQPFGGWKGSGSTGKSAGSLYYVTQYLREQSQTRVTRAVRLSRRRGCAPYAPRSTLPPDSTTAQRWPARAGSASSAASARRAGAFGDLVRVVEQGAHRGGDRRVVDLDDVVRAAPQDLQRRGHRHAHRHAVGHRVGGQRLDRAARAERLRVGVGARRHDADDLRRQPERVARGDQAASAGAASDRHVHAVERRRAAEQLERIGRDARDQRPLERPDERESALARQRVRVDARLVEVAPMLDQRRAERAHRGVLRRRIAERDDDRAREAVTARGEREALAVVAARRADHAGRARAADLREPPNEIEAPATLNAPVGVWFSCLTQTSVPARCGDERPGDLRRRRHRRVDVAAPRPRCSASVGCPTPGVTSHVVHVRHNRISAPMIDMMIPAGGTCRRASARTTRR